MLQKFILCSLLAVSATSVFAQDSLTTEPKSTLTISGSADVYYRYDITGKTRSNNLTSFTNSHNSFELGMASMKVEYNVKGVTMVADLGFGKRASEFSYNESGILAAVKQLYISYQPKDWVKITAGSWATHIGYEVVDPHLNRNYSMSYMFSYGPFFHTGVKAEFYKGIHSVMIGAANATDYKYYPLTGANNKFVLAQYGIVVNRYLSAYLNYTGGRTTDSLLSNQLDLVLVSSVSDKVSLGFNGTFSTVNTKQLESNIAKAKPWYGAALYATYSPKEWVSLSVRGEYFNDNNGLKVFSPFGIGGSVYEATLSANFKTHGLTFIPEFRFDGSDKNIFTDNAGNAVKYNVSFAVAAIYNFSFQPKIHKKG